MTIKGYEDYPKTTWVVGEQYDIWNSGEFVFPRNAYTSFVDSMRWAHMYNEFSPYSRPEDF